MTSDKDAMEKAAEEYLYLIDPDCDTYGRQASENIVIDFKAGWRACLHGPAVTALVNALVDCEPSRLPPVTRAKRIAALAEFEKLRGGK